MDNQDLRSAHNADASLDSPEPNSTASTAAASQAVTLAQIEALLAKRDPKRAELRDAAKRCLAAVKDYDKEIARIRKEADAATDKILRKDILIDADEIETRREAVVKASDRVLARIDENTKVHEATELGKALGTSSKRKESFKKKLQGLPAAITDKASHARQNVVKERYEGLRGKLEGVRANFSEDNCDALLQEADKLAWVTIEASGELREELLQVFRAAVRTHAS